MRSSVDDVESGNWEQDLLVSSQISDVSVQGNSSLGSGSSASSQRNSENGIGSQFALVVGAIEFDEEFIQLLLLGDILANNSRGDDLVDVLHGSADTLAHVLGFIAISQFDG